MTYKPPTPFPTMKTERLILRQLVERDANEIYSLRSNPIINKYLDRPPCNKMEDALNFIRNINEDTTNKALNYWAIALIGDDTLIGTICLFDHSISDNTCEIGYELLIQNHGKGYMREAAKKIIEYATQSLGITTIIAWPHLGNHRSTHLLQKLDFQKTEIIDETNPDLTLFRLTQ